LDTSFSSARKKAARAVVLRFFVSVALQTPSGQSKSTFTMKRNAESPQRPDKKHRILTEPSEEKTATANSRMKLSPEQEAVIEHVLQGRNVLLLGGAGTGKSTLIDHLADRLTEKGVKFRLSSMTGASAMIIGGMTLHSTLGIGLGEAKNFDRVAKSTSSPHPWTLFDLLIIDEVSMMTGVLLTRIDETARIVRCAPDKPFGGLQILAVGDFHQLPPTQSNMGLFFDSDSFRAAQFVQTTLKIMQRAKTDPVLMGIMERFRRAAVTEADVKLLNRNNSCIDPKDKSVPHLFARRNAADEYNIECMMALKQRIYDFNSTIPSASVRLCVGCRVMFIVNVPILGLVNGSLGTVVRFEFENEERVPVVDFDNGVGEVRVVWFSRKDENGKETTARFMPLIVAYGLTIHKAQGSTFPRAFIDATGLFSVGQAMVALSRTHTLDGMQVVNLKLSQIKYNQRCIGFQEEGAANQALQPSSL